MKKKTRTLTAAEQRRLAHLEEVSAGLKSEGYRRTDLTVGIVFANVVVLVAAIPVIALGLYLYYLANGEIGVMQSPGVMILFLVLMIAFIVIHELIHGITWSFFAENGFRDIEFGIMRKYLTPYCTCGVPLTKSAYITGVLMPLLILGIIPAAAGILLGSPLWLDLGLIMILSAGGDILIAAKALSYKAHSTDILYYDHPTEAGLVVFER